jgi:hypothetical protein
MSKIPKELLFNTNQIFKIIKNEIISINENITYKHYIEPIMNNPYDLSLKLKLNNPICGFKEPPLLSINTRTGTGADFVPLMKYYSSYTSLDQTKLSSVGISTVIDCI